MAKFSVPDPNDHEVPVKPAMDEVRLMNSLPPTPKPAIPKDRKSTRLNSSH